MSGSVRRPAGWPAEWIVDGDPSARPLVVLAHGAGAPMDSPFMNRVARGLAAKGRCVIRFEFGYMGERRRSGRRPGPGRAEALTGEWLRVIEQAGDPRALVIGGKSMGGRVASLVADQAGVAGLVCLGYPFHPPGKGGEGRAPSQPGEGRAPSQPGEGRAPSQPGEGRAPSQPGNLRVAHLESLRTPALIVQGSRDAFGGREEVAQYRLSSSIRLLFLEGGDHSYKSPRGAAESEAQLLERAIEAVDAFVSER